jgi:hypothetical protein
MTTVAQATKTYKAAAFVREVPRGQSEPALVMKTPFDNTVIAFRDAADLEALKAFGVDFDAMKPQETIRMALSVTVTGERKNWHIVEIRNMSMNDNERKEFFAHADAKIAEVGYPTDTPESASTLMRRALGCPVPQFTGTLEEAKQKLDATIEEWALNKAFPRDKTSAITADDKTRARFFALVGDLAKRYKLPAKEHNKFFHEALEVESLNDWAGTFEDAVLRIQCTLMDEKYDAEVFQQDIKTLFNNAIGKGKKLPQDVWFQATGDKDLAASLAAKRLPSDVYIALMEWIEEYTPTASTEQDEAKRSPQRDHIPPAPPHLKEEINQFVEKQRELGSKFPDTGNPADLIIPPANIPDEIVVDSTTYAVVPASTNGVAMFPAAGEWTLMKQMAEMAIKSRLLPKGIDTVEKALYVIEVGRELGIQPSVALRKISIIQGQPTLGAELMVALVKRSGLLESIHIESSDDACKVTVKRRGESAYTEVFTMDMARQMQTFEYDEKEGKNKRIPLADKFNWRSMPRTMLKWRALSGALRTVFPDITLGIYTSEEMQDSIALN